MKKEKAENPPAFARGRGRSEGTYNTAQTGMSLRDYFAGQALEGFLAGTSWEEERREIVRQCLKDGFKNIEDFIARFVYKIADAMVKERQK